MRNNYSNYLGVVTSAGASDEHPLSIHSASIRRRWKPRGLQVLLTLVFLFSLSIGQMWGAQETVTKVSADKDEWVGTCATIDDDVMTTNNSNSYVKIRTGNNSNRVIIHVKSGYKITGFSIQAYSNNSTEGVTIPITSITYDGGANLLSQSIVLPVSGSKPSSPNYTNTTNEATDNITLTFDNSNIITDKEADGYSNGKNKQMMAIIILTYEELSSCTHPTIAWATEPANGETTSADFTASVTTTPANYAVTWTSSNTTVASVTDGVIDYKAAGSTKITASLTYSGSDYCEETVSVEKTITVATPKTYHTITPNFGETDYEIYGLRTQILGGGTTVASGYSAWVNGEARGGNNSQYSIPSVAGSDWWETGSGKNGYGYAQFRSTHSLSFYVTNCSSVSILQNGGGSSRSATLSVKKNGVEVDEVKYYNANSINVLTYTGLNKSDNYVVTISTNDSENNTSVYQIRFEAPAATKYTVTFNNNGHGGTAPTAQSNISSGGKATEPTAPTDEDYDFGGWWNKADYTETGAAQWNFSTSTVTKDTTLYAKWTLKPVSTCTTPTVDATFAADATEIEIAYGDDDASTNLTFTKGSNTNNPTFVVTKSGSATSDASVSEGVFTATKAGTYKVTATQAEDGTYCEVVKEVTITVTEGAFVCPTVGAIYRFKFKTDLTNGNVYNATTGADGSDINTSNYLQTLYGGSLKGIITSSFNQMQFYDNNAIGFTGGTNGSLKVVALCDIKTGYVLKINNTAAAGNKFTVSYKSGGADKSITIDGGGEQKVAFTEDVDDKTLIIKRNSSNPKLTELSIFIPYVVTLNANGGTCATAKINAENNEKVALPHAAKDGYFFDGWYNGETPVADLYTVTADVTLTAHYTLCSTPGSIYKFEVKSGLTDGACAEVNNFDVNVGNYLTALEGGMLTGYNNNTKLLIAHNNAFQFTDNSKSYLKVDLDCALAKFDKFKTTVADNSIYVTVGNSRANDTEIAAETEKVTYVPEALVGKKTFYIWRGGGNAAISYLEVIRPVTHTISFDADGGSAVSAITVETGTKATKPTDPTKDNADFVKWVAKSTGADFSWDGVITSDTVLKAVWDAWPKLTLKAGTGATGEDVVSYHKAATSVSVPANPGFTKEGYSFNGWSASQEIVITDGSFPMPATDLTLTATWVEDTYEAKIGSTNYATVAAAIAAVADGQTITLLRACSYDAMWEIADKTVTLDLNGQNLTYTGTGRAVEVQAGGNLILMDGTATVAPTINLEADPLDETAVTYTSGKFELVDGIRVINGGTLTINSGRYEATEGVALVKFTGSTVTVKNGVLISRDNGVIMGNGTNGQGEYTINIEGGILIGKIVTTGYASMVVYHPNVGALNISGGTLVSTNGPAVVVRGGESDITGGTIIAQGSSSGKCGDASLVLEAVGVAYDFKSAYPGVSSINAEITGGNIAGEAGAVEAVYANTTPTTAEEAAVAISGGTFNTAVAQSLCADGFVPEDNGDGSYGVTAIAESVDIEDYAINTSTNIDNFKTWFSGKNYTYANLGAMDKTTSNNGAYAGVKTNSTDAYYQFWVPANKRVTVKLGYMAAAAEMYINGVKNTTQALTGGSTSSGDNYAEWHYDVTEVSLFKLQMKTNSTCVLKAITIGEIPEESDDATLSDLKIGGTTVAGFSSSKYQYYVELPYGTAHADFPVVTVTTNEEHAVAVVNDAKDRTDSITVVHVTAQDGVSEKYYNVYFSVALKQGVTLVKGSIPADNTFTFDASASYLKADEVALVNSGVSGSDDTSLDGRKFQKKGYLKITPTQAFQAGDLVAVNVTKVTNDTMRVFNSDENIRANVIGLGTAKMTVGVNCVTLTEDASLLVLKRGNDATHFQDWNPHVSYVEVQRYMDPFIESFKIGEKVGVFSVKNAKNIIDVEVDWNADVTSLEPTIKAYANGGATLDKTGVQNFSDTVEYNVSSAYAEDGSTKYYVVVTKAAHYVAQIGETQYTDVADAFDAVAGGQTITLLDDCSFSSTWTITDKTVTLDLNGKNLTGPNGDGVEVGDGGKLILMDGSATVDPAIDEYNVITYAGGKLTGKWPINVVAGGEFVMNGGWIVGGEAAVWVGYTGVVTVNNGVLEALENAVIMAPGNAGKGGYTINVHGGILLGHMSEGGIAAGYVSTGIYHPNNGTLNIDGGTIVSENGPGVVIRGGESNITGGTIIAQGTGTGKCGDAPQQLGSVGIVTDFNSAYPDVANTDVAISGIVDVTGQAGAVEAIYAAAEPTPAEEDAIAVSGGTFNTELTPEVCAAGYIPSQADPVTGKYTVTPKDAMCLIKADITDNNTAEVVVGYGATKAVNLKKQSTPTTYEVPGDKTYTGYKFNTDDNGGSYFYVTLANGSFLAGDSVEVLVTATASAKMKVFSDKGATLVGQSAANMTTGKNPVVLTANADTLYLYRGTGNSGWNPQVAYISVYRVGNPIMEEFAFESLNAAGVINQVAKTVAVEVPYGTNVTDLEPTIHYVSNGDAAENAVTPAGAQDFSAPVVYKITDKDGSSTSYTVTVSIAEPSTDATLSALSYGGTAITLEDGVYDYTVNLAKGTTYVPALAATAHSAVAQTPVITNAATFENYEATSTVVVTAQDGTTTQTYTVHFYVAHAISTLVDVTGNTVWDWSLVTEDANGAAITSDGVRMLNAEDGFILSNHILGDNMDKLEGEQNAYAIRANNNKCYQGTYLKFHTTVPGAVIIDVRRASASGTTEFSVNGTVLDTITSTRSIQAMHVEAGDVVISTVSNHFRIFKMEFKLDNDDEPARTDDWLAPGELGTICIPQGAVAVGADIYELVGKEPEYGKIVFETVEHMKPGKPYLFQAKGNRIDLILTNETPAAAPDNSGAMKGTFVDLDLTELENVYYFAQHALWSCVDLTSLSVPANRAYVKLDEVQPIQDPTPAPGRRRVTLGVNGQTTTTGFEALNAEDAPVKMMIDGKLFILRGEKLFDATGRLVK